jgi:ParB family chromosome partitioning protein
VANLIRLLELPADVKRMVQEGDISQGHARALLPLGDEQEQFDFARRIKKEGLSQDRISALDGDQLRIVDEEGNSRPVGKPRNEQIAFLAQELTSALGAKVELTQTAKGRGRITIHFKNHDEFSRIRQMLTANQVPLERVG